METRRSFLRSLGILGGALVVTRGLAACAASSTNGASSASDDELVTCAAPVISHNHGHALVVTPEDVAAAVEKTYDIKGQSSHPHDVTLTTADFAKLAHGGAITVTSTTTFGHAHDVTVTCAQAGDAGKPDAS